MVSEKFCIVLTTTSNQKSSERLINELLKKKLAACIQVMPINSHYVWEGEVCNQNEVLLIIKTKKACYSALEKTVCALHEYDVPQIVQVPVIEGFAPYLSWLEDCTES
ncbi:MAG: divalent-cation tolerance protein CutA [Endozoicomonadaceae bacterium]|nr:divalent-cation tolerance protein CutA [Endozoicomonadaceae bacterium]